VQKTLALAEELSRQLAAGTVNQSGLARLHGLTRARITQVLNLLKLDPSILDFLRTLSAGPRARFYTERRVRPLLPLAPAAQLRRAHTVIPDFVCRESTSGQRANETKGPRET
jgi:hypothetical protein